MPLFFPSTLRLSSLAVDFVAINWQLVHVIYFFRSAARKPCNRGKETSLDKSEEIYLSNISLKDKPWDTHRGETAQISSTYSQTEYQRYAERTANCSPMLGFGLDDEHKLKLQSAYFCRCRHCSVCQWRRTLKWMARFFEVLPKIQADYPTARFLFLTLTIETCELTDLRSTLQRMNKGWERLSQRKQFPAIGWIKSVEVTKSKDGRAHPHFHCMLMVKSSYFTTAGGYLSQKKWRELWQSCMRIDYDPSVHVRAVKGKAGSSDVVPALKETFKYAVKPQDVIDDPVWLEGLTRQLHKTRAIALGGVLRQYFSEKELDDPDNLVNVNEESSGDPVSDERFYFGWREKVKRYAYNKPQPEV
jgi:plasmid rolling circle replication initiator protein Rep